MNNNRYYRQKRKRSRTPIEEEFNSRNRRYNSLDELNFKDKYLIKSPIEGKKPKSRQTGGKIKRSISNFDFEKLKNLQELEELKRRERRKSSNKNLQNLYERINSSYKRKHRTRNNPLSSKDYLSSMSHYKSQKTRKNLKQSESIKNDIISKYFNKNKREETSTNNGRYKSIGGEGDYQSSALINRTLDRSNLKDSIMKKYRTNEGGRSSNLYSNFLKKKIIANALENDNNTIKEKKHRKSKTLSDANNKLLNSSFYSKKREKERERVKRVKSGIISKNSEIESSYSRQLEKYQQSRKRRKPSSSKRKKRIKSLGGGGTPGFQSNTFNNINRGNIEGNSLFYNSTTLANFKSRSIGSKNDLELPREKRRSSSKKGTPSNNNNRRMGSQSNGQIKISEFESSLNQRRRRSKSRNGGYPNIESIQKNAYKLPPFEKSKVIVKQFGNIHSFSVNTHQGTVRNYNEDRVSILLNAQQR